MPAPHWIALADAVEEILVNTALLLAEIDPNEDGARPTDCPGWSVQDQVSHMVGLEQVLAGATHPPIDLPPLAHVESELDAFMERPIQARRALPFIAVIDELNGMLPRRIAQYRELIDQGDPEVASPLGSTRPLSKVLPIRVFDLWVHEQDIRRALGVHARLTGVSSSLVQERILDAWQERFRSRVATDGLLRLSVGGARPARVEMTFGDGGPIGVLDLDLDTLARLACGRGRRDEVLRSATVAGSRELIDAVLDFGVITP